MGDFVIETPLIKLLVPRMRKSEPRHTLPQARPLTLLDAVAITGDAGISDIAEPMVKNRTALTRTQGRHSFCRRMMLVSRKARRAACRTPAPNR
jgi:hypothetical protein